MSDDYLWDKTGGDPDVEALERLLAPASLVAPRHGRPRAVAWLAGIAAAALFAVGALQALRRPEPADPWVVLADGRCQLTLGRYGEVFAEPDAKVRVLRRDDEIQRLRLDRGTIHASITRAARPRLFQVETPAATCIDLGCHYTLSVDEAGVSRVSVQTGRVAFHNGRREIFIPERASGMAAPGRTPYTPLYDDASPDLRNAVALFDAAPPGRREKQARDVAALVRKRDDGLVAWHLMQDQEDAVVTAAHGALVGLSKTGECGAGQPTETTLEAALKRDPGALRKWRDVLFPDWATWD